MSKATRYEIRVEGHLSDSWSSWFEGMAIEPQEGGETILSGPLVDEAALHGVLMKIRDLGLPLIQVTRVSNEDDCPDREGS
ncbi:MAG: hypothetical protein PVJ75_06865 [Chloroflexota bacterium]|jgi:hypothetical protein